MTTTRTCVGCQTAEAAAGLVRLMLAPDGEVVVDPKGGASGRGAWLHARPECVERGVPRGLSRALKTSVNATPEEVAEKLRATGVRRLAGLLAAAHGAKLLAAGASAVEEAFRESRVRLLLVAEDARAAASSHAVGALFEKGLALVVLDKVGLGRLVGREEAGVVALLDGGFAASVREAVALASFVRSRGRDTRSMAVGVAP